MVEQKYKDEYGRIYKKKGNFWRVFRDGQWWVISGDPLFKLEKIKE